MQIILGGVFMIDENKVFELAQNHVFKWEGGLTNDKDDNGGITNYGVSLRFLKSVDKNATKEDIVNMTKDKASKLFKQHFWDKCQCGKLNPMIAIAVYDFAVNAGVSQSVKLLQRVVGVKDDGVMGETTIKATKEMSPNIIVFGFFLLREDFYRNLAQRNPSQKKFLAGWNARTSSCRQLLKDISYEWCQC